MVNEVWWAYKDLEGDGRLFEGNSAVSPGHNRENHKKSQSGLLISEPDTSQTHGN
jgi:hypothetical protein